MLRIDSHQHFWLFNEERDGWITDEMSRLRRNFLPVDVHHEMQAAGIHGCVAVQANQSEAETHFLLSLARENPFIQGVVGWIDLCAGDIEEKLQHFAKEKKLKGFRHILQGENDRAFMLTKAFNRGISALQAFGFTYDVLIFPDQLPYLPELIEQHPEQMFVIDHIAKPNIKKKTINKWQKSIQQVASYPNVWCKISGMATEADWQHWQPEDFTPYLDVVWNAFGTDKVMFGSDWPVCLLAVQYRQWIDILEAYTSSFTQEEQEKFWGKNATVFYCLTGL